MTRLLMGATAGPLPMILAGDAHGSTRYYHTPYTSINVGDIDHENFDPSIPHEGDITGGTYVGAKWYTNVPGRWYYSRAWMMPVAPEVSNEIIFAVYHDDTPVQNFVIVSDETLHRDSATGPLLANVTSHVWVCFEVGVWSDHTTQRRVIVRVNGVQVDNIVATDSLSSPGNEVRFGIINPHESRASGREIYIDDVAVNDDVGSENNSWPGVTGRIIGTIPERDVTVGANWKGGGGGDVPPDLHVWPEPVGQRSGYWWRFGNGGHVPEDRPQDVDTQMIRDAVPFSVDTADFQFESYQWEAHHNAYPGLEIEGGYQIKVIAAQLIVGGGRVGEASLQAKILSNAESDVGTVNPPEGPPGYDKWLTSDMGYRYLARDNYLWDYAVTSCIDGSAIDPTISPVVRINKAPGSSGTIYASQAFIMFEYEPVGSLAMPIYSRKYFGVV